MNTDYVHKDSTTLVQDELVKNELNQIELQYNALKQQKFNELLKENQELKAKINGVYEERTYLYNKLSTENEQLNILVNSCQEEIRELKKQLEEKENIACNWKDSCLENAGKIEELETQQKEFIKYLEDYLKLFDYMCIDEQADYDMIEEILQKYKSIIGVSDENNMGKSK